MGRGGGLVVSILAFYSDDLSFKSPANYIWTKRRKTKRRVGPSLKKEAAENKFREMSSRSFAVRFNHSRKMVRKISGEMIIKPWAAG